LIQRQNSPYFRYRGFLKDEKRSRQSKLTSETKCIL